MSILIEQARKGDSDAMLTLYKDHKERVLWLCALLLESEGAACGATARIFRGMWAPVVAGDIETEEAFGRAVTDRAADAETSTDDDLGAETEDRADDGTESDAAGEDPTDSDSTVT